MRTSQLSALAASLLAAGAVSAQAPCSYEHRIHPVPGQTVSYTAAIQVFARARGNITVRAYSAQDGRRIDMLDADGNLVDGPVRFDQPNSIKRFSIATERGWHSVVANHAITTNEANGVEVSMLLRGPRGVQIVASNAVKLCPVTPDPETPTEPETPVEPETPTPEDPPCTTRDPCPRAAIPVNIQGVATGVSSGEWTDPRRHRFHVSATWDEATNAGTYAINVHYRDRLNGGFRAVNSGFNDRTRWRHDPRFVESFDTADGFPLSAGWAVWIRVCARMFVYDQPRCSGFVELRVQEGTP